MTKISFEKSSGNVFTDIGFTPAEAAASLARFSSLRGLLHFAGARAWRSCLPLSGLSRHVAAPRQKRRKCTILHKTKARV